jgi:hypothetical protein
MTIGYRFSILSSAFTPCFHFIAVHGGSRRNGRGNCRTQRACATSRMIMLSVRWLVGSAFRRRSGHQCDPLSTDLQQALSAADNATSHNLSISSAGTPALRKALVTSSSTEKSYPGGTPRNTIVRHCAMGPGVGDQATGAMERTSRLNFVSCGGLVQSGSDKSQGKNCEAHSGVENGPTSRPCHLDRRRRSRRWRVVPWSALNPMRL